MDSQDIRWFALLGVILVSVFAHAMLPRYEWRTVGEPSAVTIVVYDRWTGRLQRAVYENSGALNVMGAYVPFAGAR